jgi:hypothetical protein
VKSNFPDQQIVTAPSQEQVKMSEVLEHFVEPYRECAATPAAYRSLLTTALIAWNMALLPKEEREAATRETVAAFPAEVRSDGEEILRHLLARKETLFAQHTRAIIDFELVDTGGRLHLTVVSTATRAPESARPEDGSATPQAVEQSAGGWSRLARGPRRFLDWLRNL